MSEQTQTAVPEYINLTQRPSPSAVTQHNGDNYWQTILESLEDELVVIGRDMRIRWANAAVHKRWKQRTKEPLISQPCHLISHTDYPCGTESCHCPLPEVFSSGQPSRVVHAYTDGVGSDRYMEIVTTPLRSENGDIHEIVEVRRDVTNRHLAQRTLMRRNLELDALHRVSAAIGSSLDLDEILNTSLEVVLEVTGLDAGTIYIQQGGTLILRAIQHFSKNPPKIGNIVDVEYAPCGLASLLGQAVVTQRADEFSDPWWEPFQHEELHTVVHIPLLLKDKSVGILCLGSRSERHFDGQTLAALTAMGRQIAVAVERSRLHEELARRDRGRRALLRKVITAQEDERKRIARELHDEIMQSLTALLYSLEAAAQENDAKEQAQLTSRMWDTAQHTLDEVHNLIHDLRPTALDNLGLFSAVCWLTDQRLDASGVATELTYNGTPLDEADFLPRLSPDMEIVFYRVIQEAINNIANHAQAQFVAINFGFENGLLSVTIKDDGIGFDLEEVAQSPDMRRGLGLMSMWERMESVGGKAIVSSTPGEGAHLNFSVPLNDEKLYE